MKRRRLLLIPLVFGMTYGLGFLWFLRLTETITDAPAHADAIVVLTGGPERIETGLRLLVAGHATNLLISGLGSGTTMQDLARRTGMNPAALGNRVTLGRKATTTRTNATETAEFARAHDVRDLIVVTAGYHMPRALLEMGRAMPAVVLHPAPVLPTRGAARAPSWRLLLEEYTKWLVVSVGLSGQFLLEPLGRDPARNTRRDQPTNDSLLGMGRENLIGNGSAA